MKFSCPHCSQRIEADESHLGSEVACPACGGGFFLPTPVDEDRGKLTERLSRKRPKASRNCESRRALGKVISVLSVIFLIVVWVCVGLDWLTHGCKVVIYRQSGMGGVAGVPAMTWEDRNPALEGFFQEVEEGALRWFFAQRQFGSGAFGGETTRYGYYGRALVLVAGVLSLLLIVLYRLGRWIQRPASPRKNGRFRNRR